MKASGSGNLATMASGFPYAIGAQVAFPDRRAVAFVGDGAFTMLMAEMLTAVKYKLPLVVDPNEANLPPKIPTEQAINFMKAMAKGQPNPVRIGLSMFRNKVDEILVQGIGGIPGPQGADKDGEST
jgi:hypothetical protein